MFFSKVCLLRARRHGVNQGLSVDFLAYFQGAVLKGQLVLNVLKSCQSWLPEDFLTFRLPWLMKIFAS